jgi:hypothetical protein
MSLTEDMVVIRLLLLSVSPREQRVAVGLDEKAGPQNEMLHLAAGVADLVAGGWREAVRRLPRLAEVREELRARGELALRRNAPLPEAHTEVLSRQVVRRTAGE